MPGRGVSVAMAGREPRLWCGGVRSGPGTLFTPGQGESAAALTDRRVRALRRGVAQGALRPKRSCGSLVRSNARAGYFFAAPFLFLSCFGFFTSFFCVLFPLAMASHPFGASYGLRRESSPEPAAAAGRCERSGTPGGVPHEGRGVTGTRGADAGLRVASAGPRASSARRSRRCPCAAPAPGRRRPAPAVRERVRRSA